MDNEIAKIGDYITLQRDQSFLCVDLLGNIVWEKVDNDNKAPTDRCVWKLCQRLSYTEQEMATTMQRRKSLNAEELAAILDEAILENERNQSDINESQGSIVNYGRVIQLQSVVANKYITSKSEVCINNRDYLSIQLEDGSSAAYFKVQPKYKIRSEGGNINYGDDILLTSIQQHGYYLNEQKLGRGSDQKSKSGYSFNDASLSRTTVDTSITISLYARYHAKDDNFLKVGKTFRLFDREAEGFIQAFCTIDKQKNKDDLLGALNPMDMKVPELKVPDMKMPEMKMPPGMGNVPGMPLVEQKKELTPFVSDKIQDPNHPDSFSPKMVFLIEPVDRKKGGLIEWNKQNYKIRHISTGKYLTVGDVNLKKKQGALAVFDMANQMNAIAQAAAKAAADSAAAAAKGGKGLANAFDLSIPKEEELYNLKLEYESTKPEHTSRQVFQIKSVDKPQTNIPKQDVMIIISHVMENGTELVFHVNENRTVCMSSTHRSYDALLIVDVPEQNEQIVTFLSSAIPVLSAYVAEVEGRELPDDRPKLSDFNLENKIIENIILGSILGGQSSDAFSAEGPPLPLFQNCARDQKILDLLMAVVAAPTNAEIDLKLADSKGTDGDWLDSRFVPLVRVHKLAWRAVSFLTKNNPASEFYFLSIKVITKPKKEPVNYLNYFGFSYFESMTDLSKLSDLSIPKMPDISQINLPGAMDINDMGNISNPMNIGLGSFQDMGNMKLEMPMSIPGVDPFNLVSNEDPFASGPPKEEELEIPPEHVSSPSLSIIVNQISHPVGAAEVLTTLIDNNPQLQTKVVDKVMIDYFKRLILDEGPSSRFIEFFQATCMCQGTAITRNQELCLTELVKKTDDYDRLTVKLQPYGQIEFDDLDLVSFNPPETFLGEVNYNNKTFPQLIANWNGSDEWTMGSPTLYYSPTSLGMEIVVDGSCTLEELLWVLEPTKLCSLVKKESWISYERQLQADHQLHARFSRHLKIAEYFLAQIELYGYMLSGRPYNIIAILEQIYPYEFLLSAILNKRLPSSARAAFITLLQRLWLERFPHEENCGRLSIPTRMWVYTWLKMYSIHDHGALPYFKLHSKSVLLQSPNPIEYLNTPYKFILLNKFVASYLGNINRQVAENKSENILIKQVITLTNMLSNYGFFPSVEDILQVVHGLLRILDGRSDVENSTSSDVRDLIYSGRALEENEGQFPDEHLSDVKRYALNESNLYIIDSKKEALKLMQTLSNFRLHFALQRYLYLFRLNKDTNRDVTIEDLNDIIIDSNALDFSKLSDIPYDATLIDLIMYQDESLFEEAFTLLCMEHSVIHLVLDNAAQVMLMSHERVSGFGTFDDIEGIGSDLRRLLSTAEVWGKVTPFNEVVDVNKYKSVYAIIGSLVNFLKITPVHQRQELILQLNIHKTLFQVLSWDFTDSTKPGENSSHNIFALAKRALDVLKMIVSRNKAVQKNFVSFHELVSNQAIHFPVESYSLLVEIFRHHEDIVARTDPHLFTSFSQIIGDYNVSTLARQFFYGQLALDRSQLDRDIPFSRNQSLVVNAIKSAITSNKYSMELSTIVSESTFTSHIEIMEILGLCGRQNYEIRTKLMSSIIQWETVAERVHLVLNSATNSSDHGLGITRLSNEENASQIRRSRFLASAVNFLNWINLSKGFDGTIVKEAAMMNVSRAICSSVVSDKSFTNLLVSKNLLVRTASEEELYAKLSFLLALVQTNVCSDSELLQNIVVVASLIIDDKETAYSGRITLTSRKILEILMPAKTAVDSFRPGEADPGEVVYKESIKGKSDELMEFNKEILEKCTDLLYSEKLSILYALMNAQTLTDPNDPFYVNKVLSSAVSGNNYQEVRSNTITWRDLVKRFIAYIDRCIIMSRDLNISMKIMELFCFYLSEGENSGSDVLIERQNELNSFGVTSLIHRILQRLFSGVFVVVTLKLGILMMRNGNRNCQDSFVNYAKSTDSDGKFFNSSRNALNSLNDWIIKTLYDPDTERLHEEIACTEQVKELTEGLHFLKFLTSLCATNNLNAQVVLHDQSSFNRQSVDLLENTNLLIETLIPHRNAYRNTSMQHMEILIASLDLLISALMGPCSQNQAILERNKTFYALKIILSSSAKNINVTVLTHLKCLVVKLLYSCLEGRFGTPMEDAIIAKIDLKVFDKLFTEFCQLLDQFKSSEVSELYVGNIVVADNYGKSTSKSGSYNFDCKPITKEVLDLTLRDLTSVRWRLAFRQNVSLDDSNSKLQQSHKNIMDNIVKIEIYWIDHTEIAYFPLPYECQYLSETSKMEFLNSCDLSSPDSRVKSLMDAAEIFFDEMIVYRSLIQKFPLYSTIMKNYYPLKLSMFGLSLLLNIAVMLSFSQHGPSSDYFSDYSYSTSQIVLVLGICLLAGYFAILVYWILPNMPLRYRELSRLSSLESDPAKTRNWAAFNILFGAIAFSIALFVIHYYCMSDRNDGWALIWTYICIGITVFVPWFIYSYRSFLVVPKTNFDFVVSISIDLLSNSNIITTVIFVGAIIGGLLNYVFLFSLLLLDFMLLSEQAMNVIRSVIRPWRSLTSIFLVYCICICIFGFFGILLFGYSEYVSGDELPCNSLTQCMGLVFYGGLRTQDIANIMNPIGPDSSNPDPAFPNRLFFDLLFFIVLGVLLFNMVTGIIVDTFASLREETETREAILRDETFISGLVSDDLEKAKTSFNEIQNEQQHVWNYVYYIYYLKNKNPFDYDGIESFVAQCINNGDHTWCPKKTCASLERNFISTSSKQDDLNNRLSALELQIRRMEELITSNQK